MIKCIIETNTVIEIWETLWGSSQEYLRPQSLAYFQLEFKLVAV